MKRFKKWLIPVVLVCLLLASLVGCSQAPASLGQIFDPSGNPFANRFTDVSDYRTATFIVAASDSVHKYEADYKCNGTDDHVQIQAAIDKLPATGGEVSLLDGTYNIEVSIAMTSYQTLRGCGRNTILTTTTINVDIITATGGDGTEKEGLLIADLCVDGNAGGAVNDVGILWTYVDYSKISNIWVLNNGEEGIFLVTCDSNEIVGNFVSGNAFDGISLWGWPNNYNIIKDNICQGNTESGIKVWFYADDNLIIDNICQENGLQGIELTEVFRCTISGNICWGNTEDGINAYTTGFCIIGNNLCYLNGDNGIYTYWAEETSITDNICIDNSQTTDNTSDNIYIDGDRNLINDNLCRQGTEDNQPQYGINIADGSDNRVFDNDLYDGGKTAPFNDAGTNTKLPSITVPFSDGDDPQDSGYLIDLATEYARAWSFLNLEVVQVVRIKVYARAVPAEADKMRAEFVIYGGKDDEAYTTHNGSVANHPSTSSSFQADDVIYWTITTGGVLALTGGDSVEIKVLHEDVGDGDIDTQAYFRTVTIEYV